MSTTGKPLILILQHQTRSVDYDGNISSRVIGLGYHSENKTDHDQLWSHKQGRSEMFFVQEGFTYRNFLMDALAIFFFIVWFWLLISVAADLFRRRHISGWVKAIWVIALILFPYLGVLAYLIFQGSGLAERNVQQAQQARDELRRVVVFITADEIEKA